MIVFRFIVLLCAGFLIILAVVSLCAIWQHISWFHTRHCKHCGHRMEYKGLKDDEDTGHFLFHCHKCGAWEQIPKSELYRCNK